MEECPPDIMNHNLETVPRLYRQARPGADYEHSLKLLSEFKKRCPDVPTKSGLMVGLGETDDEIIQVMRDLRAHNVDMLTIGQYLQPTEYHLPVLRYVTPDNSKRLENIAYELRFTHAAAGAMVRSSYHAATQAEGAGAAYWVASAFSHLDLVRPGCKKKPPARGLFCARCIKSYQPRNP